MKVQRLDAESAVRRNDVRGAVAGASLLPLREKMPSRSDSRIRILPRIVVSSTHYRATMAAGSIASQHPSSLPWRPPDVRHQSLHRRWRRARDRGNRRGLRDVHLRRGRAAADTGRDLEQLLVSAVALCGDQLHRNWIYVAFAAAGSWIGAFASITFLQRPPAASPPVGAAPH